MQVVLLENVKKLGKAGEVVKVSDGYARNFLFPKKLAQSATAEALKKVEKLKAASVVAQKEELAKLTALAKEIKDKKVTITAKAKNDKLFGSIDATQIAKEIKNQLKIEIDRESIILEAPIKEVGEKKVDIMLAEDVKTNIVVEIKGEK